MRAFPLRTHGTDRGTLRNKTVRHDAVGGIASRHLCHDSYCAEGGGRTRHAGTNPGSGASGGGGGTRGRGGNARIAVAGLNPHAGENGHMGTEDETIVKPALPNSRRRDLPSRAPTLPTRFSLTPSAGISTELSPCITIRGTFPSKCLHSTAGSTPPWDCRSSAQAWITARPSKSPGGNRRYRQSQSGADDRSQTCNAKRRSAL